MIKELLFLFYFIGTLAANSQDKTLPDRDVLFKGDGSCKPVQQKAVIYKVMVTILFYTMVLRRGLFRLSPNVVCTDFKNMITGQQLIRAVMPEAVIIINGKTYNVGGLYGQKGKRVFYCLPALIRFSRNQQRFSVYQVHYRRNRTAGQMELQRLVASNTKQPTGKVVNFTFRHNADELKHVIVKRALCIYDVFIDCKMVTLKTEEGRHLKSTG
jgi:hypothetical protein